MLHCYSDRGIKDPENVADITSILSLRAAGAVTATLPPRRRRRALGRRCAMQLRDERCARSGRGSDERKTETAFRTLTSTRALPLHSSPRTVPSPTDPPPSLGSPPHRCPSHRGWRAPFSRPQNRDRLLAFTLPSRARFRGGDEREKYGYCGSENHRVKKISSTLVRTGDGHGAWWGGGCWLPIFHQLTDRDRQSENDTGDGKGNGARCTSARAPTGSRARKECRSGENRGPATAHQTSTSWPQARTEWLS